MPSYVISVRFQHLIYEMKIKDHPIKQGSYKFSNLYDSIILVLAETGTEYRNSGQVLVLHASPQL